jgi:hypothetical protein
LEGGHTPNTTCRSNILQHTADHHGAATENRRHMVQDSCIFTTTTELGRLCCWAAQQVVVRVHKLPMRLAPAAGSNGSNWLVCIEATAAEHLL